MPDATGPETTAPHLHVVESGGLILSERDLITLVLAALKTEHDLFTRDGHLVEVVQSPRPEIVELDRYTLRERLFSNDRWQRVLASHKVRAPAWLEVQLLRRREWKGLRPLTGLIHTPMLRPDGSAITEPGYDEATGLYLTGSFPLRLPDQPTQDEAKRAYRQLLDFTRSLPLQGAAHRAAFIAAMMTPLARRAIDGAAPLFLFDSPTDRAPSLLADVVSLLACGKPMTQLEKPPSERVFRRRLAQAELNDETLILIDGAETYRSGEALRTALFNRTWVDGNARSHEPQPVTWFASGNNIALSHAVSSLVLPIRTDATEDENGQAIWKQPPGFEKSVLRERPRLIEAALTVLRGYFAAGQPPQEVGSFSRFEAWAGLIAGAVVWAGGRNPLEARKTLSDYVDDDHEELGAMIVALSELIMERKYVTVRELLWLLKQETPAAEKLREALELLAPGEWQHTRKLAALLKKVRGRRVNGVFIARVGEDRKGFARWSSCVDQLSPPEARVGAQPLATAESRESIHATSDQSEPSATPDKRTPPSEDPKEAQMTMEAVARPCLPSSRTTSEAPQRGIAGP